MRVCAAAAVALALGCAPRAVLTPPPATPTDVRRAVQLDAADVQAIAALLRMEDARELDTDLLDRLLRDAQPEVRGRAALAAGRLRDPRMAPLLTYMLQDGDVTVRARAAFALGLLQDSSEVVLAALTEVALRDLAGPASEAVAALGRIGAGAARPGLEAVLAADDRPAAVRNEALLAAWRLPRNPGTITAVSRWAAHPEADTRWRAVYSLARGAGPAAIGTLIAALHDDDARVRAQAVRGLRTGAADSAGQRQEALAALLTAVEDPDAHVRINAARLLPGYGDTRTARALTARLREEDVNVGIAAAQALAEVEDAEAALALAAIARDAARPDGLRAAALAAWIRQAPAAAAPLAGMWADSSRWLLRYHAARSLGTVAWSAAAPTLERLARDPHPVVAAEALTAIRTAADTVAGARRIFVEGLGAPQLLVRAAAARGLGRYAGVADLDLLLGAYERARTDTARDAALAAVEALGRLAAEGVPVDRTFFLRFESHPPSDAVVHRAIAEQIGTPPPSWGQPLTPQPRELAFYVHITHSLVAPVVGGGEPPVVAVTTPHGDIVLELAAADAPLTVHNFLSLIERGYYEGTRWHRVVPNFVIQDGDPRGDGLGGPGYAIRDEINPLRYLRGTLGMALAGPDTGGSQFFITHSPQPHLDGGYTVFGRVSSGMDVVDRVVQEEPILGFRRIR